MVVFFDFAINNMDEVNSNPAPDSPSSEHRPLRPRRVGTAVLVLAVGVYGPMTVGPLAAAMIGRAPLWVGLAASAFNGTVFLGLLWLGRWMRRRYQTDKARWRPRFSLRTFLLVVLILGGFLSWLDVQVKWIRDRHEALATHWHGIVVDKGDELRRPAAPWSLRIFGERGEGPILVQPETDEAERDRIRRLFSRIGRRREIGECGRPSRCNLPRLVQ